MGATSGNLVHVRCTQRNSVSRRIMRIAHAKAVAANATYMEADADWQVTSQFPSVEASSTPALLFT